MGLFDRSFLITTGITAVICGAILYYVNTRMRELEIALAKQNQVLSSFIANVQQEFRLSSSRQQEQTNLDLNSLASDEAIQFVANMEKIHEKIVVTDSDNESVSDDESDVESVSDDESVSDNESISDEDDSENKLVICDLTQHSDDIRVIELNEKVQTPNTSIQTSSLEEVYGSQVYTPERMSDNESDDESDDESDESEADTEYEHVSKSVHVEELPVELNIVKDETKVEKVNLNNLKVDELRKLALDKGVTKEESKKLKKNELLALLNK